MNNDSLFEFRTTKTNDVPTGPHLTWLRTALRYSYESSNYKAFTYPDNSIKGYLAWAKVSAATLERLRTFKVMPRYLYEWKEGNHFIVFDYVDLSDNRNEQLDYLKNLCASNNVEITCTIKHGDKHS